MDSVMGARRRLLMMGGKPDTSPRILQFGVAYPGGNPQTAPLLVRDRNCITVIYPYEKRTTVGTITNYGLDGYAIIYKNNAETYMDYWSLASTVRPYSRTCLNVDSDGAAFTLRTEMLDDCYAYINETGEILFAGKNSIYYGYKNINDMPTA